MYIVVHTIMMIKQTQFENIENETEEYRQDKDPLYKRSFQSL